MRRIAAILLTGAFILTVRCSGHKPLTNSVLLSAEKQTSDLVGLSGFLGDDLLLTPVVQKVSPLSSAEGRQAAKPLFMKKMSRGEITHASADTVRVTFDNELELAFCRYPEHMTVKTEDGSYYLNLFRVRHMDGTKSFVVKSGTKLYLPSFAGWSCRLLINKKELAKE